MKRKLNKEINIFFTVNDGYVKYLSVAIASILYNSNREQSINFYILDGGISDKNKKKLNKLKYIKYFNIEYIKVDNSKFENIVKSSMAYISNETNYRFIISSLKPELDKCLFLDADLIVDRDITELYNIDIDDFYMAAVADQMQFLEWNWAKNLNLAENYRYVNTGVILVNLKRWREENIEHKLFENVIKYSNLLKLPDQDTLNITLQNKVKYLNHKYNALPVVQYFIAEEEIEAFNNPVIIHWAGPMKPWIYTDANYSEYFWKYAKMTDFYEEIIYSNTQKITNNNINNISNINSINRFSIADFILSFIDSEEEFSITILGIRIRIKKEFLSGNNTYYNKKDKIFSIYQNNEYKRITIFGIKITIKRKIKA